MPIIKNKPRTMEDGTNIISFTDSVGTDYVTYTFETNQEALQLANKGLKPIEYVVGASSGSLQPGASQPFEEVFSSFQVKASQGVQQFEIRADEEGTKGVSNSAIASLDSKVTELTTSLAQTTTKINLTRKEPVKMVAHRGYSIAAPENSIPAYELAGKLGFWGAETDVKCTSDGYWILMHDGTVDRTTDGTGSVENLTLSYIQSLTIDVGNNISRYPSLKVPTLEEYLECCSYYSLVPIIELKSGVSANLDGLLSSIYDYGFENSCIIMSFTSSVLQEVRSKDSKIKLMLLTDFEITQVDIDTVKGIGYCDLSTATPTQASIVLAHKNNIKVNCWTVNDMNNAITYKNWNVDSITTDKISEVFI